MVRYDFPGFSFPREPASFFREYDYRLLSTQKITYVYIYHKSNKLQSESPKDSRVGEHNSNNYYLWYL